MGGGDQSFSQCWGHQTHPQDSGRCHLRAFLAMAAPGVEWWLLISFSVNKISICKITSCIPTAWTEMAEGCGFAQKCLRAIINQGQLEFNIPKSSSKKWIKISFGNHSPKLVFCV